MTTKNFGSDVFPISFSLQISRNVPIALRPHSPLAALSSPDRVTWIGFPPWTSYGGSSHDAEGVGAGPASRETKVAQFEMTPVRDEDVGGLEIEVNDVAAVEVRNSSGDLGEDLPHSRFVEDFVQAAVVFEEMREVPVLAKLGFDVEVARLLPSVDEGDEVRGTVVVSREESEDVYFLQST